MMSKSISERRAKAILTAYGADPARWPSDERQAMLNALESSAELRGLRANEAQLDAQLATNPVPGTVTVDALLAQLPDQPSGSVDAGQQSDLDAPGWLERFLDWITPSTGSELWRSAALAAVPLVVGLWIGTTTLSVTGDWSDSEQYVFAPLGSEVIDG